MRSQQGTDEASEILAEARKTGAITPFLQQQLVASADVSPLDICERSGGRLIMQDQADLGIQHEGADISVAGSDYGDAPIDGYVLRVKQSVSIAVEAHAHALR
ncbi:hypothetical protein AYR46_16090 [Sphingobium yanoikuyae]|nr:hypothetical protein BV87_21530 [Sphingobium yanoikuyae]KZC78019.1 hypothetical protein AYR46_16090 [Sphingobium yanoikuyae]GFE77594.1 hypothetical protein NTCA1_52430 [Novosphingobium sp. TCA1]